MGDAYENIANQEIGCPGCQQGTSCNSPNLCTDCYDISPWTEDYHKLEIFPESGTEVFKIVDYTIQRNVTLPNGHQGTLLQWVPYDGG